MLMLFKYLIPSFVRYSFGGGGGGTTSTQKFEPPDYTVDPWKNYIAGATNIANNTAGLQPYGGQTVADLSPMTQTGLQMFTDYATQGTPERTASGQAIVNAAGAPANPYATVQNPYMGENPYLSQMIDASNAKIGNTYRQVTQPQSDAALARSGAFGGSAWQDVTSRNQQDLAAALAANTNSLLGQNYNQSANLAESGLNRATQAYQSGQSNALQAAGLGINQQAQDQAAIGGLLQAGQIPGQYQQNLLNAAQQYYQQGQQVPFTLSDYLGSALARASGNQGTQTYVGPGQSPITGILGGAALAYPFFSGG